MKHHHLVSGSVALACACICAPSYAAEIDAGAMLNKYRQELSPDFLQLPMATPGVALGKVCTTPAAA